MSRPEVIHRHCVAIRPTRRPARGGKRERRAGLGRQQGCVYCYARPTHEYLGFDAGLDFETKILVKEQAPQLLRTAVEVRCPFFDARMLELVGILSPMQRSSDKPLQRHAIGALAPALAKIPWERTGLPLTAGFLKTHGRRVARVLRRKTHSILERQFGNSFKLQSGTKMIDYDEMIRTSPELRRRVEAILLDRWAEGSRLFNRASLQALLDHHRRGAGNHAEIIGRILTIEMWHQLFVCNTAARQSRSTPQPREHVLRMAA